MKLFAAAGMAALVTACATGPTQNDLVAANSQVEPGSPDEMICRNERITGELIPRRVCMTKGEREALSREGTEVFDEESLRNLRINPDGRGG